MFLSNLTRPGRPPIKTDSYLGVPVTYNVSPVYIELACDLLTEFMSSLCSVSEKKSLNNKIKYNLLMPG